MAHGINMIPHNKPWITQDDRLAVDSILKSGWIAPGKQTFNLESEFQHYYDGGYSCAVSSGTAALFLALRGLGAEPGKEVALPTYACSALLNAINMTGATPKLVDVTPDTFTIDPDSLEKLAPNASIVIAIHTYGARANIESLRKFNVKIIEDCCHSLGGIHNGKTIGMDGDASIFSFYATKIITGGQGGLIWSNNKELIDEAHDYRNFDCRENYYPRFNFQLTDIQAAMINSQFKRLKDIVSRRYEIAQQYIKNLPSELIVQEGIESEGRMVYRFVIKASDNKERDALKEHLYKNRIKSIIPIERYELLHRYLGNEPEIFPVSEMLANTTLSIPIFPALTDEEVSHICNTLRSFKQ